MLKYEYVENGNRIRYYSDTGMMIRLIETGVLYKDAVCYPELYTFEETDFPIVNKTLLNEELDEE